MLGVGTALGNLDVTQPRGAAAEPDAECGEPSDWTFVRYDPSDVRSGQGGRLEIGCAPAIVSPR